VRLLDLPTWASGSALHAIVETPRGSPAKLKYEPRFEAFMLERRLPDGVRYPYDWGFFPRTLAEDGDPLDVMILHDATTHPGMVIECTPLAVLRVTQKKSEGKGRERNDRILAVPSGDGFSASEHPLGSQRRTELENFFESSVLHEDKEIRFAGWGPASEAKALVRAAQRKFDADRAERHGPERDGKRPR
jgi:inorganic pyrophosphatase